MKIKQTCCYVGHNYNILLAILVTPKDDGFIIALKWWNFHVGVYFTHQKKVLVLRECGDGYDSYPQWEWR